MAAEREAEPNVYLLYDQSFVLFVEHNSTKRRKRVEVQFSTDKSESINLDRVLLLNKVSRLDVERFSHPGLTDDELESDIRKRGIDYAALSKHHAINDDIQKRVLTSFQDLGINVRQVNRLTCSEADIDWCDAVFPVGGDGTFLFAARQIPNWTKPVIGFNSDPSRSEGFLCLPKQYSFNPKSALRKLMKGKFKWMFRTRIRVTFTGDCISCTPTELFDIRLHNYKIPNVPAKEKTENASKEKIVKRESPILALNEVFMSEIFAAKISYFEMRLNDMSQSVQIKSSGLCVCTGTGSTSWNLSINRLSRQDVKDILQLYLSETKGETKGSHFDGLVTTISDSFNEKFKFEPGKRSLRYTIRDLIHLGVWPHPKGVIEPRGFADTIELKSKCLDAAIIVDGAISFPFNEGSVSRLETYPEDALRTVVLSE